MITAKFEKNYCPNLFSWKELSDIVNQYLLLSPERFKVNLTPDYISTHPWVADRWTLNKQIFPSHILKDIIEEYVCYIREMSRCTKNINAFAKSIEDEYNMPTDAHIYMCKNMNVDHPFGIHFDKSHNVIVQCEGETNFKVWDKVEDEDQKPNQMNISEDPILDVDMQPGDTIWIPKSFPHLATSNTPMMSVSFPFIRTHEEEPLRNREWIEL